MIYQLITMQFDPWHDFVGFVASLLAPFQLQGWATAVAIIPFLVIVYLAYIIFIRLLKTSFRKVGMPQEATTGIVFAVRLVFFAIALLTILAASDVLFGEGIIALSALIGTAVGLAFSKSLGNLVAGLYVFASRPFRVGDYVRIGRTEGIVTEITLNYTRLLLPDFTREFVPNLKVIESELNNYRIRIDDYNEFRRIQSKKESTERDRFHSAIDKLKFLTTGDEIYRYTFDVYVHKDFPMSKVKEKFGEIVQKWEDKFLQKPEYFYMSNQNFGIVYRFAIIVKDPYHLLTIGADFQTEVAHSFQT